MKKHSFFVLLASYGLLLSACGGAVDVGTIAKGDGGSTDPNDPSGDPVHRCSSFHGTATLGERIVHGWPACAFNFALASQDPKVTRNRFDVYYEDDLLINGMISGDPGGTLVDLGDVPLASVPQTVDPSKYPTGNWGKHDALQPFPKHTYFQRLDRTDGTTFAAFRVLELVSGDRVTIEWIRSTKTDAMVVPAVCLP